MRRAFVYSAGAIKMRLLTTGEKYGIITIG